MAEQNFPILVAATDPRSTPDGAAIVCTLRFADGVTNDVAIQSAHLPQLLNDLRTFGSLAEAVRRNLPADTRLEDLVAPYSVSTVSTTRASSGEIIVKFGTDQGVPILLSFSAELALQIGSKLKAETEQAPEPPRKN